MRHPSIICWIGMNEPGCVDPDGDTRRRFMEENPGPRLYRELQEMDPDRPIIKGSFCDEDILAGTATIIWIQSAGASTGKSMGQRRS